MGFRFMHAADIHLDSPLRGLERYDAAPVAEMRSATRKAFVALIDDCIAQRVAFLLLVGDLYDGDWKDYNTGLFLLKQIARLRDEGIAVYVVRGNHDAENSMTKELRPLENMHVFESSKPHTLAIEGINVALHGQSYGRSNTQDDLSLRYPKPVSGAFNIGLLHTSADGSSAEHKSYAPCAVQSLADKGYDYWALGHIHRRQELRSDPYIVFPGNLQGRHAKETGPKGATLVAVEGDQLTLEAREHDVMRWCHRSIALNEASSPEQVVDLAHAELARLRRGDGSRPLAVRLELSGPTEAHRELVANPDRWVNQIRACAAELDNVWVEKIKIESKAAIDLDALRRSATPLGEVLRTIDGCRVDASALTLLASELEALEQKLSVADDGLAGSMRDPERMQAMLDDIEQLLIPLLMEEG